MFSIIEHSGAHSEWACLPGPIFVNSHQHGRLTVPLKLNSFPLFLPSLACHLPFCLGTSFYSSHCCHHRCTPPESTWCPYDRLSMTSSENGWWRSQSLKGLLGNYALVVGLFSSFSSFMTGQELNLNSPFPIKWCRKREFEFSELQRIQPVRSDLKYLRITPA